MTRDNAIDSIILKNFFKDGLGFFIQSQPSTETEYLSGYASASYKWIPLKAELDSYPLSGMIKNNLIKLFDLAEDYFCYVNSTNHPYRSSFMEQKWEEMRRLAKTISQATHLPA